MPQIIHVGMADHVVVKETATLVTLGLGSCIGLVIYDPGSKLAAMAHIMLPTKHDAPSIPKPGKFADTAVPILLEELFKLGASKTILRAKMAGGAQMFSLPGKDNAVLAVGARNIESTIAMLKKHGIQLVASSTGGNRGRSIEYSTDTHKLIVKTLGAGSQEI